MGKSFLAKLFLFFGLSISISISGLSLNESLEQVIASNDINTVISLIDKGIDINLHLKDNMTPIMWTVWFGFSDMTKVLIEKGANLNQRNSISFKDGYWLAAGHLPLDIATTDKVMGKYGIPPIKEKKEARELIIAMLLRSQPEKMPEYIAMVNLRDSLDPFLKNKLNEFLR